MGLEDSPLESLDVKLLKTVRLEKLRSSGIIVWFKTMCDAPEAHG
jgi:hypothetical protein